MNPLRFFTSSPIAPLRLALTILLFSMSAAPSSAALALLTLDASDRGWFKANGEHVPTNPNYVAGQVEEGGGPMEVRNFFIFDLPPLGSDTVIVAATLSLFNPESGFASPQEAETFTLFEVAAAIEDIVPGSVLIFDDLGSGTVFGQIEITDADNASYVVINLNTDGLSALNQAAVAGVPFAVGGALTSISTNSYHLIFSGTSDQGPESTRLELQLGVIPEPAAVTLIALALCGAGLRRHRRTTA